ncbi:MAG: sulfurtransferase [Actinomycetota bacterium]
MIASDNKVPAVVTPEQAHGLMQSGSIVFADVRWYADGRDPRTAFAESRIRNAVFIDVDRELSDSHEHPATAGRHPFPDPEDFAAAMGRAGIGDDTWVVAYDDTGGMTAARLVVMLRMLGRQASLLDGGLPVWTDLHPDLVDAGNAKKPSSTMFTASPWPNDCLISDDELTDLVRRGAASKGVVLLDARSRERFEGRASFGAGTLDPRAGHIPGAVNAPWTELLSPETRRLRQRSDLRSHFAQIGVDDAVDVIASCGSGISACLDIVAIEHAGLPVPRLYVASWSGWSSDESRPIESGTSEVDHTRLRRAMRAHRLTALRDLRRARRHRRLANVEWFEALYRVYLAAFVFGGGAMFISGFVPDEPVSAQTAADIWANGPAWLGLAAVLAIGIGLRSGSRGGPLAIEEADVRHVLLAPIARGRVLLRPAAQTLRTSMFATTIIGALAGYLAARRLPGTAPQWVFWGGVWGAVAGALYVGSALVAHGLRVPRWIATTLAVTIVSWQLLSALPESTGIALDIPGVADTHGDLALAFHGIAGSALTFPTLSIVLVCAGLALTSRQSVDALLRRSALVSQLRFAVTVQDLRTVTLLRRRLSEERSRSRPWFVLRRSERVGNDFFGAEWKRAVNGLARFPLSRIVRIVLLCIVSGLAATAAYHGTSPAIVIVGAALFMVALEALEPLAQEIDQADRTASYPHPRGLIHIRLTSPVMVLTPVLALVICATTVVVERDMWLVSIIGSLSAVMAAFAGAAVNIVSGAPDPTATTVSQNTMPPEVAGTVSIVKSLWPVALSIAGGLPFVFASLERTTGRAETAALRAAIAVVLGTGLVAGWIFKRDDIRRSLDQAISESRGSLQKGHS